MVPASKICDILLRKIHLDKRELVSLLSDPPRARTNPIGSVRSPQTLIVVARRCHVADTLPAREIADVCAVQGLARCAVIRPEEKVVGAPDLLGVVLCRLQLGQLCGVFVEWAVRRFVVLITSIQ